VGTLLHSVVSHRNLSHRFRVHGLAAQLAGQMATEDRAPHRPSLCSQNVVCTLSFGRPIDLRLAAVATSGRLDPGVFPAYVSKCRTPKATNMLFAKGKVLSTGAVSFQDALLAANLKIDMLHRKLGIDYETCNFFAHNQVASGMLPFQLNLNLFLHDGRKLYDRKWEPKLFPGLKLVRNGITFILFTSGALIVTGTNDTLRLIEAQDILESLDLARYELNREYCSLEDVQILDGVTPKATLVRSRTAAGARTSNPIKVINHSKKKAAFKECIQTAGKRKLKRSTSAPPAKRSTPASVQFSVCYPSLDVDLA
jgi:TATA-box binding protein (TBP) (component of TFIID and TFIIIB)